MKQSAQLNQSQLYSLILNRLLAIEVSVTTLRVEMAHFKAEATDSDVDEVFDQFNETADRILEGLQADLASDYGMMPEGLTVNKVRKDLGLDDDDSAV